MALAERARVLHDVRLRRVVRRRRRILGLHRAPSDARSSRSCAGGSGSDQRKIINFPGTIRYGTGDVDAHRRTGPRLRQLRGRLARWATSPWPHGRRVNSATASRSTWPRPSGASPITIAAIWYDPRCRAGPPPAALQNVRLSNDIVICRTGWDDRARRSWPCAAAAPRTTSTPTGTASSSPPSASGSCTIRTMRPTRTPIPHWLLRLTAVAHGAADRRKGHQYHDGHEGTNASWAEAARRSLRRVDDGWW